MQQETFLQLFFNPFLPHTVNGVAVVVWIMIIAYVAMAGFALGGRR